MKPDEYKCDSLFGKKFGKHDHEFYYKNINPYFRNSDFRSITQNGHIDINWSYIDGTDFTLNSLIILGGKDICRHFTIVIGVDTEKRHYLITDQSLKIWLVDSELFESLSIYKLTKSVGLFTVHSIYRIGDSCR